MGSINHHEQYMYIFQSKMIATEGLLQEIHFTNPFKTFRKTQMKTFSLHPKARIN